jgi:hypothetical protein
MKTYGGMEVQLHESLPSLLDGGEWSAPRSGRFIPREWGPPPAHTYTRSYLNAVANEYEGVSKSFRTSRLARELQMVQLSATGSSCIAILWDSLVSFAAITLYVASRRVFIFVYFVTDSVLKL